MRKMRVVVLFLTLLLPITVTAVTPEQKGLEIAREADRRDSGWNDSESKLTMILRNRHGDESRREMRGKSLEVQKDGDKTLTTFDTPKDVKGTAFLNFTHKVGDDDQWLYLPALKRVKRIASRNKSGSFVGSEFAYEDISSQELEKYTYKWLRDEIYQGRDCYVVESYPVDKKYSGYTRLVSWIDKAEYRSWKIEFYDRKKSHFKTLTFKNYKQYLGKYWRPGEMNMVNHQNGKSTQLIWHSYRFRTGLSDRDFTKNSLKRAK
ncbi:outer membrane lipoprotein-sorting protein [Photobacterium sp. SDRW27]|uniref:outer membrane lipoprotein-sorting protein n=1 Tax=Photobacterium obscurum TaxID=2829490 RepID=UPI002242E1A4|nr:outer membrane lipoprotein-sorting protein [Photobacterium obscurum]MCW8328712.1 outer membrane lipoprotein-sorting protein [Photobacterium obscurum]